MIKQELKPTSGYETMPLWIIIHLQKIEIDEFWAEDSDDRKDESGKSLGWIQRDIDKTLSFADPNKEIQQYLRHICSISFTAAHSDDKSYKPLCDAMREIGYTIVEDSKEQKKILSERRKLQKSAKEENK